jgi:soluble lytic murein transglycosylase-like protein
VSFALIPAVALLVMVVVTPGNDKPSKPKKKAPVQHAVTAKAPRPAVAHKKAQTVQPVRQESISSVESDTLDATLEYKTILTYIKSKYKRIKDEDAQKISQYLVDYGKKHKVDPKFAAAVIARESSFNKEAVSVTGAKGLGQIKDFNFPSLKISNPFDIRENVSGTTQYLKEMLGNWENRMKKAQMDPGIGKKVPQSESEKIKLALASYYKGFTAVNRDGLDPKTNGYVSDIIEKYNELVSLREKVQNK